MTQFSGLAAFPITPTDASGRVDADALQLLLKRLTDAGVASIGLLGSTGLYPFFSRAERRRAIEIAVAAAGGTALLVGIGALRTDDAVLLGQDAKAAGASAALLAPVSYTPLTADEVFVHFETVAQNIDLPVCIYNNPGTTHFTFTPDLIARLSRVPGIIAVKNPAPPADVAAHLQDLRARTPDGFSLGYSVDWNAIEAMLAGGDAWYSVLGGLFPAPCLAILAAVKAGDAAEARRLNARLQPLWDLFTEYSSLRVMFAAANALGIGAEPPRPLLPLPEAVCLRIAGVLRELGLD
ncbi:dihydrodipicolinate synthase family protein [Beijerinckia sp. L45]|uniref:dihydrodipicolinate synthase family protein n=1 Tax=Beijerinckia sp. L45 TaxID=1641855 RepID=UPI00131E58E3|nr:dihydrodipicolinate synthase family protein [Beijerinckia sp. L45]